MSLAFEVTMIVKEAAATEVTINMTPRDRGTMREDDEAGTSPPDTVAAVATTLQDTMAAVMMLPGTTVDARSGATIAIAPADTMIEADIVAEVGTGAGMDRRPEAAVDVADPIVPPADLRFAEATRHLPIVGNSQP